MVAQPAVGLATLAGKVERLPIVVEDLPSEGDRAALAAYRRATVRDHASLQDMVRSQYEALVVSEADRPAVDSMLAVLFDEEREAGSPSFDLTVRAGLRALEGDPRNADRLGNLLVGVWLDAVVSDMDRYSESTWFLRRLVVAVLDASAEAFPGHRATLLNLAFLKSQTPGLPFAGEGEAQAALALDAGDVTARALLASIQSRRAESPDGAERAAATLQPFIADPATTALGEALLGDAHLAVASIRRPQAPAQSRLHASLALAAYDRAIAAAGGAAAADPGLRAGRARALELQGDVAGAARELSTAIDADPSLDWRVELARLRHRSGDIEGLRAAAVSAVSEVRRTWNPSVAGLRYVMLADEEPIAEDRGFLGWSIGSDADHLPISVADPEGAGAPGVVVIATVPLEAQGLDHELTTAFAPYSAWRLALAAAIIDGDPEAADSLADEWESSLPWSSFWRRSQDAARLVAERRRPADADDDEVADALELAEQALRRAGRLDQAAELCRALAQHACAGADELRAGDPAAARADLHRANEIASATPTGPPPELRMLMASAAEAEGDLGAAESFLQATAGADEVEGWRVRAAIRLGDMRLDAGDPGAAVSWYELALAAIDANGLATVRDYHQDAGRALEFEGLRQVARNNRGVALLRSLQPDHDSPPACSAEAVKPRCEAALADVTAAAASDPSNAVYRMNIGWAARLLGRADAARTALQEAVGLDPTLYPAFNDLGVLLAQEGDAAAAREAFSAALAARADYDLARWNLGILALHDVPRGFGEAQARLAEAIRTDPSLRAAPLAFRTDERTYRFGFEAPLPAPAGMGLGRTFSIGAVVLGAAGSVAALAQLQATLFGHGVQTAAGSAQSWLERQARRARWRARQRALRRRLPRRARALLPWLAVVVVLGFVTGWQAAQASPTAALAAIVLSLFATAIAVVVHAAGHLLAAQLMGARLLPAAWVPGALVALAFLPLQAASGPFLGERLRLTSGGHRGAWRFHLAGPLANALVGVLAYLVFILEPWPVLRLIAQVQLAAIAYSLLPIQPLDGWALKRERPRLLVALGFGVVGAGAAFALGLI